MKGLHHAFGGFACVSLLSSWLEAWMGNCTGLLGKENARNEGADGCNQAFPPL